MMRNAVLQWLVPALVALGMSLGATYVTNNNTAARLEQKQEDDHERLQRVENKIDQLLLEMPHR